MKQWHCNECGKEWKSEDGIGVHFHACPPSRRSRHLIPPDLEGTTLEEVWLGVFADAYGYQPPSIEQAREETGQRGRRKDGTGRSSPREMDL